MYCVLGFKVYAVSQELFEIHAEFTKLEKIEFTGIKGKQLSSQTMQIFDDFNELYKKFTFVTYDPLNPEDAVSICFDFSVGR